MRIQKSPSCGFVHQTDFVLGIQIQGTLREEDSEGSFLSPFTLIILQPTTVTEIEVHESLLLQEIHVQDIKTETVSEAFPGRVRMQREVFRESIQDQDRSIVLPLNSESGERAAV